MKRNSFQGHRMGLCLVVLMFLLASVLVACAPTAHDPYGKVSSEDIEAAKTALSEQFEKIAQKDSDALGMYYERVFFCPEDSGLSAEEFIDHYYEGFEYRLGDAYGLSDREVELEFEMRITDAERIMRLLGAEHQKAFEQGEQPSYEEAWAEVEKGEMKGPYNVVMEKDDEGVWAIQDKAAFGSMILGGYDPRQAAS